MVGLCRKWSDTHHQNTPTAASDGSQKQLDKDNKHGTVSGFVHKFPTRFNTDIIMVIQVQKRRSQISAKTSMWLTRISVQNIEIIENKPIWCAYNNNLPNIELVYNNNV